MTALTQPFRFPKKLWLIISFVCFLYLFLGVAVNYKDSSPTAWRSLLDGELGMAATFGVVWLVAALAFGAFVAAILGVASQLFRKHK